MRRLTPQRSTVRCLVLACCSLVTCHLLLVTALGQSATATLSGTVEDQNGALIPGATVTAINAGTALQRETTTGSRGDYAFPLLPPGTYIVRVQAQGFVTVENRNVVLNVSDQKALQIALKAGNISELVQINNEPSLINESPAVGTVIDRQFVGNLPLNGRSFQSLIQLTPGVVLTPADRNSAGQFSVNGQRSISNYFTVDGVSANIGVSTDFVQDATRSANQGLAGALPGLTALGTTSSLVSIDALEEYRLQTSTYSAEFGRQPGGQIALVTRSGTNQFHGTAFDYLRNDALDARDWFNTEPQPKPPLRQNQFGGTFSGPVILPKLYDGRSRTFLFFSYEALRLLQPASFGQGTFVPSLRLRNAATAAGSSLAPILDAFPLPTGPETLFDDDFDPTTPDVLSGDAPFIANYSNPSNVDSIGIRIDHRASNRLALFGRYNEAPSESLLRSLNRLTGRTTTPRTLTLGATLSVTSHLNNEFRFNYSKNRGQQVTKLDDFGGAVPVDLSQLTAGVGTGRKTGSVTFSFADTGYVISLGDSGPVLPTADQFGE